MTETQEHDERRLGFFGSWHVFLSLGPRRIAQLLGDTFDEFSQNDVSRLGAALAYYTIFSIAPLLVVVISVAGLVFGEAAVRGQIVWQIEYLIGRKGAEGIQTMLQAAAHPAQGVIATIGGLITLFLGASLVISELRNSLNFIWKLPPEPGRRGVMSGLLNLLQRRLFAFFLVLAIGFLMLVSLLMNAAIAALGKYFEQWLPASEGALQSLNFLLWFLVTTVVFGLIYKVLPDIELSWGDVAVGSAMTSLLFTGGKLLIALYLGKSTIASAYGAAGSVVIVLAWVYYSAQVFFFGALFTHVYANRYGSRPVVRRRQW